MTQVKIDIGKLDPNGIVDLANDSISVTPTSRNVPPERCRLWVFTKRKV